MRSVANDMQNIAHDTIQQPNLQGCYRVEYCTEKYYLISIIKLTIKMKLIKL